MNRTVTENLRARWQYAQAPSVNECRDTGFRAIEQLAIARGRLSLLLKPSRLFVFVGLSDDGRPAYRRGFAIRAGRTALLYAALNTLTPSSTGRARLFLSSHFLKSRPILSKSKAKSRNVWARR